MLSEHFMISSRNLLYGMIITRLLRYFKVDLSSDIAYPPSIDINRTLKEEAIWDSSTCSAPSTQPPSQLPLVFPLLLQIPLLP